MKTMNVSRTVIPCGMMLFTLLCLALTRPVSALPTDPGSLFSPLGPVVRITSPANHATFYTPVDLPIFAFAHDGVDTVAAYGSVDFYASNSAGRIYLGKGMRLSDPPPVNAPFPCYVLEAVPRLGAVYCVVWTNAPAGSYALTAVATNTTPLEFEPKTDTNRTATSAPVNITIVASVTNNNPADVVSIVASDPVAIAGTNACWTWPGMTNATPAWTNWPPNPSQWGTFTNWGPKNGMFTVRRFGNAVNNLTVNYSVSGTAVSNVDYVGLPGSVTIPAGKAYVMIPVVPLDSGTTNYSGTVVLSLKPDPEVYTLGIPSRAAVIIRDYWPRPLPWLLTDRLFHFNTNGPDGAWFSMQNSGDLQNWTSVATNQVVHGSIDYVDPDAPSNSIRFYRFVPLTNGPAE
jgi:hypothetical protein